MYEPIRVNTEPAAETMIKLDPIQLLLHASTPVKITTLLLIVASTLVWLIAILKFLQLSRLRSAEREFEHNAAQTHSVEALYELASQLRHAPGARVVLEVLQRTTHASLDRLRAIAERAIVSERQRASSFMSPLGSIASSAPFIGLFGTVYGIMDAFIRIGAAKSASLPVVAPAIGEALITTAIGLVAAIPAVIFYNAIDRRVNDLISELEASSTEWVLLIGGQ